MSAPKNSRGPWRVHLTDETVILDADGDVVATTFLDGPDYEENYARRAADALLIATTTHLLEALRKIAAPQSCGCVPCRGQCRSQEALQATLDAIRDEADAAIAKATQPSTSVGEANTNT